MQIKKNQPAPKGKISSSCCGRISAQWESLEVEGLLFRKVNWKAFGLDKGWVVESEWDCEAPEDSPRYSLSRDISRMIGTSYFITLKAAIDEAQAAWTALSFSVDPEEVPF